MAKTKAPAVKETSASQNRESLNTVALIGRLTANPVLRYTATGKAVANFRFAVNGRGQEVAFHNITAWGRTGELVAKYLTKGRLVSVGGRLTSHEWLDGDTKRTSVGITAQAVQFLDRSKAAQPEVGA